MRFITSLLISLPMTFMFLFAMSVLMPVDSKADDIITVPVSVAKVPEYDLTVTPIAPKSVPEKQDVQMPEIPEAEVFQDDPDTIIDTIEPISTTLTYGLNEGISIPTTRTGGSIQGSQEAVPVLIKSAIWPRNANSDGKVKFCFTINPDGTVSHLQLMASEPARLFVSSAKRAIRSWKFRPAYENGQAIAQENMCYTMEFILEQ